MIRQVFRCRELRKHTRFSHVMVTFPSRRLASTVFVYRVWKGGLCWRPDRLCPFRRRGFNQCFSPFPHCFGHELHLASFKAINVIFLYRPVFNGSPQRRIRFKRAYPLLWRLSSYVGLWSKFDKQVTPATIRLLASPVCNWYSALYILSFSFFLYLFSLSLTSRLLSLSSVSWTRSINPAVVDFIEQTPCLYPQFKNDFKQWRWNFQQNERRLYRCLHRFAKKWAYHEEKMP